MSVPLVVLGAGGHAKVILEILEHSGDFEIRGCTSAEGSGRVLDYPVLGSDDILPELFNSGIRHAFVAIGGNRVRLRAMLDLERMGFMLVQAVSPRAVVSQRATIEPGAAVMAGAVINAAARIGKGAIVNTGATVDHDCELGECAHVAPGVHLAGNVRIGAGAMLGIASCVIPGISVGEWSTVGAGAVVIRDVPPGVTAVGVPAAVRRVL